MPLNFPALAHIETLADLSILHTSTNPSQSPFYMSPPFLNIPERLRSRGRSPSGEPRQTGTVRRMFSRARSPVHASTQATTSGTGIQYGFSVPTVMKDADCGKSTANLVFAASPKHRVFDGSHLCFTCRHPFNYPGHSQCISSLP